MRAVNVVVTDKGHNPAAADITLNKVYSARRSEVGERNLDGFVNEFTHYDLIDDVGYLCGIYENYRGIVLHEVP